MERLTITQCQGEGQGSCTRCTQKGIWNVHWTSMLFKIAGMEGCFCSSCVKEIEDQLKEGGENNVDIS